MILDENLTKEEQFAQVMEVLEVGKDLKKKVNTANKKMKKYEERLVSRVTELKQANKLVETNEKTIQELEQENEEARNCLNLVFDGQFPPDVKISREKCNKMYADMKKSQKTMIDSARKSGYEHANLNMENALNQNDKEKGKTAEQEELVSMLQQESASLKASIHQLTQENDALKKEKLRVTAKLGAEHRD